MQALLIIANPNPTSFAHAMAAAATAALQRPGMEVVTHDLYAEGFNPVQPTGEFGNTGSADPLVETHCAHLAGADLILVFHPNWWSQPPAIMKGWIDRVVRLGTAYRYPDGVGAAGAPQGLLKARAALVFNTSNTPPEREAALFGDPLEGIWKKSVFALCGVARVERRMYGPIASSTVEQRQAWLDEVERIATGALA
ncbi:MAG: NAD(P)H-dependent oxidoreductase [Burkholderiales bacterium]